MLKEWVSSGGHLMLWKMLYTTENTNDWNYQEQK